MWGYNARIRLSNNMSQQTRTKKTILAVLAHPDDESFGMGGTLAYYATKGVEVHLVCATRGEAGTVDAEFMKGYKSIAELREAGRIRRPVEEEVIERFLECGDPHFGWRKRSSPRSRTASTCSRCPRGAGRGVLLHVLQGRGEEMGSAGISPEIAICVYGSPAIPVLLLINGEGPVRLGPGQG